mmetsp:Transcript_32995/g.43458  ORF Transcript_32995/g.43458 Transcript_32995/m.43458 type:complete len:176 (-) Transcript_32995:1437-1964(-)
MSTLSARFPMLSKVFRSELSGYNHVRSQFENPETRRLMHVKLAIFTAFVAMMAIENTFRVLDFVMEWQFQIDPKRPPEIDFSSDYNIFYSEYRRKLLVPRKLYGRGAIGQTQVCMWLMLINNYIWCKRKNFSASMHTIHYFIAAATLVLYIPRHDWWPVMMDPKYGYTNMNIFLF